MSTFTTTYYILKDRNTLPPNSRYVDPYDNRVYKPGKRDTLDSFLQDIELGRKLPGYEIPSLPRHDLETLVVASLVETTQSSIVPKYFLTKQALPNVSQVISLFKAVASETTHKKAVPVKHQEHRASKCSTCRFNIKTAVGATIVKTLTRDGITARNIDALGVCDMCGCGLQEKIKFHTSSILGDLSPLQIEKVLRLYGKKAFSVCWILEEVAENPALRNTLRSKIAYIAKTNPAFLQFYEQHVSENT